MFFLIELGELFEDGQSQLLALLRMKLERINIIVLDTGDKLNAVMGGGGDDYSTAMSFIAQPQPPLLAESPHDIAKNRFVSMSL